MSAAARIGGFAALLVVVFAAAAIAGSHISPEVEVSEPHMGSTGEEQMKDHGNETTASENSGHGSHEENPTAQTSLPGLAVAQDGYRLVANEQFLSPERPQMLNFRIERADGSIVNDFEIEHDRRMHLIVVRRDFQGFQHLHPKQEVDGGWSVEVGDLQPGVFRVFADFSTDGRSLTLATDLFVPGRFEPQRLAPAASTSDAGDGYEVTIRSAGAIGGETAAVEFDVSLDGRPVKTLEPYLGADGHLVALRQGDQAFLHTHPEGEPGGPGPVKFEVNYPTTGQYRLFLQFKHEGKVRTAQFTQVAGLTGHEHDGAEQHG